MKPELKTGTRIWDLPTRLFHWLLVLAICGAWYTGSTGGTLLVWHGRLGLFILGLLSFRILWGFLGSTYARFAQFVRGPATLASYLHGHWHGLGHNPLGAFSVIALLAVCLTQASTGLFAYNDDIGFEGPLHRLVSSKSGELSTTVHHVAFDGLLVLVGLHLAAIFFYLVVRRKNLIRPMVTGITDEPGAPATGGGALRFLLAVLVAGAIVLAASGCWLPEPPKIDTPAASPGW